ncbi:MAG: hypothetical protein HN757_17145 [Calditrichaeota bacterium]|jgi:DNA repair photolyase|nr:hypothetical protein [Calditrichota bacterium]
MINRFIPKRVIVTPTSKDKKFTSNFINRIKKLDQSVEIVYSPTDNPDFPNVADKWKYMKETIVLVERKGSFISTFASPGDIIEDMTTVISMGWHCALDCEYCYLQNSTDRVRWQYVYTNLDRIENELKVEKYVQWVLLTLWELYSLYNEEEQTKISASFHVLANYIRNVNFDNQVIKDKSSALRFLFTNLGKYINRLNPDSSFNRIKGIKSKLIKQRNRLLDSDDWTSQETGEKISSVIRELNSIDSLPVDQYDLESLNEVNEVNEFLDQSGDSDELKSVKRNLGEIVKLLEEHGDDISFANIVTLRGKMIDCYDTKSKTPPSLLPTEYTDSFAIDHIDDNLLTFFKLMENHPEFEIQLATKFPHIDQLAEIFPDANVRISVNFNPQTVIDRYERKTYSLEERIQAVKTIQDKTNYRLRLSIEPIILIDDYEQEYLDLVHKLMKEIGTDQVDSICIGSMRMATQLKSKIAKNYPNSDLLDDDNYTMVKPVRPDTKWRYEQDKRVDIYKKVITAFSEYSMDDKVELGAEPAYIWKEVGLIN